MQKITMYLKRILWIKKIKKLQKRSVDSRLIVFPQSHTGTTEEDSEVIQIADVAGTDESEVIRIADVAGGAFPGRHMVHWSYIGKEIANAAYDFSLGWVGMYLSQIQHVVLLIIGEKNKKRE